jgi:ribonuclease BN (tRNA processing enzyme)
MSHSVKVFFLGTNGWYASDMGHTTCILLDTKDSYIILDAGSGIYKISEHIIEDKPTFIFLSHFHLDHICGLHILNKFKFKNDLTICCFKGGKKVLNSIIGKPFTLPIDELKYKVLIREFAEGKHSCFPFRFECRSLLHVTKCFGYRFEFESKIISFCTDTGYCNTIIDLSRDADLLIAECAAKEGQKSTAWPHLGPVDAATAARNAGVKKLALIHFDAINYNTMDMRKVAEKQASMIFANTFSTYDGMEIDI